MMEESKKTLIKNIIFTALYAIFTLIIVLHHEIWADEANVWLIAKNLSIFDFSLFNHLVNEGHPSFFYILVMPFAKLGLPVLTMQLLCWFSMAASVFLLLQYSPFGKFTKLSIIMSAGFLYFFPVIARSYSILPFMIIMLAMLYPKQKQYPLLYVLLLIFIANTHVIMYGFAFLLAAIFLYDNIREKNTGKMHIVSYAMLIAGLAAVIFQLAGSIDSNKSLIFDTKNIIDNTKNVIVRFFFNSINVYSQTQYWQNLQSFHPAEIIAAFCEFLFFILSFIILFLINKKNFCICLLSVGFQFFIYIFSYGIIYQTRLFCAFLILIFCFWISLIDAKVSGKLKKAAAVSIILLFLMTTFCGIKSIYKDFKYNYSSAQETAEFIKKNINKNALIIPDVDAYSAGLIVYLPDYNFYSIYYNKRLKFIEWKITGFYSPFVISQLLEEERIKQGCKNAYILSSSLLYFYHYDEFMREKYKLIFISNHRFKAERLLEFINI